MHPPFRELSDIELNRLEDDELIAYIRAARDAGRLAAARLGLQIIVFGHMDDVRRRVALKVPPHAVDLVAGEAFTSAFTSAFDGTSVGEFRKWLDTIVRRRIADFTRVKRPREQLAAADDERASQDEPAVEPDIGLVEAQSAVDQVMAELNPVHARVIDLYVFSDEQPSAKEVAARVGEECGDPLKESNVHKIAQRFRDRLKELLRGDGDTSGQADE